MYMGWVHPKKPDKFTQKVGWVGLLGGYGLKNKKTHKK